MLNEKQYSDPPQWQHCLLPCVELCVEIKGEGKKNILHILFTVSKSDNLVNLSCINLLLLANTVLNILSLGGIYRSCL